MNSWYNNTLDDNIGNLALSKADIDWQYKNFIGSAPNFTTLYASDSVIKHANFPQLVAYAKSKKINTGRAYSQLSEVNTAIAYNNANPNNKLTHMVTEIEPYNTGDYAGFYNILTTAYPKVKAAGMTHAVYMGWPKAEAWLPIVQNCDEIFLHCYRTATQMTEGYIWDYVSGRLAAIATACKIANKKIKVSIIYSCEPSFGLSWFKTHTWWNAHQVFLSAWDKHASVEMKTWINASNMVMFVTKYGKQAKP